MAIPWDGLYGRLAVDMDDVQTTMATRFTRGGWLGKSVPFDIGFGGERIHVTDIGIDSLHWTIERGINGTPATPHYAGGVFQELRHEILVVKGGNTRDYSIIAGKGFSHGSAIPVGETECQIAFETTEDGWIPDADSSLVLSSNETGSMVPYYSGLLQRPSYTERDDGSLGVSLVSRGYGHTATFDEYVTTIQPGTAPYDTFDDGYGWWRAYTPGHTIIEDVIRDLCPLISFDHSFIIDGDQDILKETNGRGKKAGQIIDEVCAQGDTGEALDWGVFTDTDGGAKLWLYRRSRWPTLNIPWSTVAKGPNEVPFAWDTDDLRNKIIVYFAGGYAIAEGSGEIIRTQSFHCENTIDDLATAQFIADTILSESQTLQLLTENPIVLTYKADDPTTHYVTDALSGDEIAIWLIHAGYLVQFPDITPRNANLPINPIQIKTCTIDHMARTATLQLGIFWDFAKMANLYGHAQAQAPNSDTHLPGASAAIAAPPDNLSLPGALSPSVSGLGSGGKVGHKAVATDADIGTGGLGGYTCSSTDGTTPLVPRRLDEWPIGVNGEILGFKITARDASEPSGPVNLTVNLALLPAAGGIAAVGTPFVTLPISADTAGRVDFDPDQTAMDHTRFVQAGDNMSVVLDTNDVAITFTIAPIFRRTEGSDRAISRAAPTITGVTASRDTNNLTTFTISTDRGAYAQIEYGMTSDYGALTAKSEITQLNPVLVWAGLPDSCHFRAHVWDVDNNEAISDDMTL